MNVIETEHPKVEAGEALAEALHAHAQKSILLMVSGGSALSILDFVEAEVFGPHVTVTMLDERFSTDPTINNFAQLEQTSFFTSCVERGAQSISTKVLHGENLQSVQDKFDKALHTWKEQNPEGFVIATMGIGYDGHTAGIFAGEYGVNFNGEEWAVAYTVPKEVNEYRERITTTYTFLRDHVDEVIAYAVGKEKSKVIERLQNTDCNCEIIPACILREISSARIFTSVL